MERLDEVGQLLGCLVVGVALFLDEVLDLLALLEMLRKQPQINKYVQTCRASTAQGNRKPIYRFFERSKMKMRRVAKRAEEVKKKASLQQ